MVNCDILTAARKMRNNGTISYKKQYLSLLMAADLGGWDSEAEKIIYCRPPLLYITFGDSVFSMKFWNQEKFCLSIEKSSGKFQRIIKVRAVWATLEKKKLKKYRKFSKKIRRNF